MPPVLTLLLDHSFLRRAADGHLETELAEMKELVRAGTVNLVVSFIHLYEISKYPDHASNLREARLIDSLEPSWLRFRLDLLRDEILNVFHRWRGEYDIHQPVNPFFVSPGQYAVGSKILIIEPDSSSAQGIVCYLHQHPEVLKPLLAAQQGPSYVRTLATLAEYDRRNRRSLDKAHRLAERSIIDELAPDRDLKGNILTAAERKRFVHKVDPSKCPTLATESALLRACLKRNFLPSPSEEWDRKLAESALPYVDVVVVDKQFADLVRRAARKCGAIKSRCFSTVRAALQFLRSTLA